MVRILLNNINVDGHNFLSSATIISIVQVPGQSTGPISRNATASSCWLQIRRAAVMGIRIERSDRACVITCEGDVTQQQVHELRTSFITMLLKVDEVAFELRSVARVNLPLIQLLCSAHRSATRLNKRFTFAGVRSELLEKTAGSAGYLRQAGCSLDKDSTCLWAAQDNRSVR